MRTRSWISTLALALLALGPGRAEAATYTVSNTADTGPGSLRQAILDANGSMISDTIVFNIPGAGPHTIAPASLLPQLTAPVTIDGYTQPGSSPNTIPAPAGLNGVLRIQIDGTNAPGACLRVAAANVTIRGLVINRCSVAQIEATSSVATPNMVVEGCFLGTNAAGTQALAGNGTGIRQEGSNGRVGGLLPAQRNLIAVPGVGFQVLTTGTAVIQGNLIGTDKSGIARMPGLNGTHNGVYIAATSAATVGGLDPAAANVIGGTLYGIILYGGAIVHGNFIGVDGSATRVLGNGEQGIVTPQGSNTIGGTAPGAANVIGGWRTGIYLSGGTTTTVQGNFIGTDPSATRDLGNREYGMYISTPLETIGGVGAGEGNVIAFNRGVGILVDAFSTRVTMRGNRIFGNGVGGSDEWQAIGIDLTHDLEPNGPTGNDPGDGDADANGSQNFPLISSAAPEAGGTRVIGTLNSLANTAFTLDFYGVACRARPRDVLQAETYLGSAAVTTNGSGNTAFNVLLPVPIPPGGEVTGTATDPDGNTSELSTEIAFRVAPGSGVAAGGSSQGILGMLFEPGATATIGGLPAPVTNANFPHQRTVTAPALPAGTAHDVVVTNPGGLSGRVRNGYVSRFHDTTNLTFYAASVDRLIAADVTAGCGAGNYCGDSPVTRAQMAVFLLRGKRGTCYSPPAATGTVFNDVAQGSFAASWIEELSASGVTAGCAGGNYCPTAAVTREQMAVFLLRTLEGAAYVPPDCTTATFTDVPCTSPFARWIYELSRRGITAGCGAGVYCPTQAVSRGQMAVFISVTFGLP